MGDEPDIVGTHILVDIDQDQHPRHEDTEQDICPLRDRVCRIKIRIQKEEDEQNDTREKQRKDQKINVHILRLL